MDVLSPFTVFLLGVALRIGLPLAATALIVWLLRRLDAHWQAEAERQQARAPVAAALPPERGLRRTPCWVLNNCPAERRATCPIYGHADLLCWQYFRDRQGHLQEACLKCQVFRSAPRPVPA